MKKIIIFVLSLTFIIPYPIFSDHFHINGKYTIQNSKVNIIYTIPIESPTENLSITLYHINNFTNGVNKQIVSAYTPRISPKPDHIKNFTDSYGNTGVILTYNYIKSDIRIESNFIFDSVVDLSSIDEFYDYPLNSSSVKHVSMFLKKTKLTTVQHKDFENLIYKITSQTKTQSEAVIGLLSWIKNNIEFRHDSIENSAQSTFTNRIGNRNGILNLSLAMLKAAGIPSRFVNGLSINHSYILLKKNDSAEINLNETMRSHIILLDNSAQFNFDYQYPKSVYNWIEIYFPNRNWVPFDPFATLFFVPCNLLKRNVALDSNDLKDEAKDDFINYPINIHFFAELNSLIGEFYLQHHQVNKRYHLLMPGFHPDLYPYIKSKFTNKSLDDNKSKLTFLPYHTHFDHNNHEQLDIKIISGYQYAQAINLDKEYTIKEIQLPLFRFNNAPQGKIWLEVYKNLNDFSDKDKILVQSKKLDIFSLQNTGNYNWVSFPLNEFTFKKGKYWFLLRQNTNEIILWRGIFANANNGIQDTVYFHTSKPAILYSPYLDLNYKLITE